MTQEQAEALARSIFLEAYPPSAEREYSVSAWFLKTPRRKTAGGL